jgi:hypothetical protein
LFSRGGGDVGNAAKFVTTISIQLVMHIPNVKESVCDVIAERNNIASLSLTDQWRQLVIGPLSKLQETDAYSPYLVVVDALDECEGKRDVGIVLQLLTELRSLTTVRLRVLITSRPETPIWYGFHQMPKAEYCDLVLHSIEAAVVDQDIFIFLEQHLREIGQKWMCATAWPDRLAIHRLAQKSNGLFIWAATACRFIDAGEAFAEERLVEILEGSRSDATPEQYLDQIYLTVLQSSIPTTFREQEKVRLYSIQGQVLGSMVVLLSPLSATSLGRLINLSKRQVEQVLGKLHAIVDVPKDIADFLRLHHPSFRDFLLDKNRCSDLHFWVDERQAHRTLADDCIRLMSNSLKQDICGQDAPGVLVAEVESSRVNQCLPPEVQYACLYWVGHLQKSGTQLHDNGQVHQFLRTHFLHWLEALSWMQRMSEGILAIRLIESIALVSLLLLRPEHTTEVSSGSPTVPICPRLFTT